MLVTKVIALAVKLRVPVVVVVAAAAAAAAARSVASVVASSSSKVSQRPCFKTLDDVTRSGKEVGEGTRKAIRGKTATLVAAAHLPYRFVEHQALKSFAQAFVELGASHS